jgi:putative heme-binding domain-containing protein
MALRAFTLTLFLLIAARSSPAQEPTYRLPDPQLKLVLIDSDEKVSFLGIRLDSMGRLFVGAREALFVYEPDGNGGFNPRQLLVRFPKDAWVYDIAIRGNDLYVSTVSAIYLVPNAVTQRKDLQVKRLIWGIPLGHVHQCFHGLDFGPEGDLYFSCGDPLWGYGDFQNRPDHWGHWTWFIQPEGTKVEYNGVGGVFRVHPDGSDLRVVARGLRNAIGLTFDSQWNLFTNDNDHESMPAAYVPGRLVHVTPHAYFSWPRGWMPSKQPHRPDLLETMNDHLGRYVPVGQADYEDSYLPEKYRHSLLVDRWGEHKLVYCPIEPRGASFKAEERDLLLCKGDARPVGVAIGNGGCVFVTVCYMAANESSPTYRSDLVMIRRADKDPEFKPIDLTSLSPSDLELERSAHDWSRAHQAVVELNRRFHKIDDWVPSTGNIDQVAELIQRAGMSQAWPDVARGLRLLAGFPYEKRIHDAFVRHLGAVDSPTQLAAVQGLFADPDGPVPQAVIDGPARSTDSYLRQTAITLLATKAPVAQIQSLFESADPTYRLVGVLSDGFRLTIPPATGPVPDGLKLDSRAQAGSYTIPNYYDSPKVDLRKLGPIGNCTMAQWWAAVKRTPEQDELFSLLDKSLSDPDQQIRYEAAFFLNILNDPRTSRHVGNVLKEYAPKSLGEKKPIAELWAVGPFSDDRKSFNLSHEPEDGPINLAANYKSAGGELTWKRITGNKGVFDFDTLLSKSRDVSDYVYFRIESARSQPAVLWVGSQQQVRVYQNGRVIWENVSGRLFKLDEDRIDLTLQPGSNEFLIRVHASSRPTLGINYESAEPVNVSLPDPLDTQRLAERLAQARDAADATSIPPEFAKIDWEKEWKTGDPARGRQLFDSLGCSKCHAATADSPGSGGPSLAEAGKRFTIPYVVESILLPSKVVSPLFRFTVIRTNSGDLFGGLVISETLDKLDLRLQDTTLKTFNKSDINARKQEDKSPMPQGLVRTPQELKDILAYVMRDAPQ